MKGLLFFADSIVFSYGQIFFANRRWFGALMLLASFTSPVIGGLGLLGVVTANAAAWALKFDREKIRTGFYGFNGILLGAACAYYYQLSWFLIALIPVFMIITFFISAVLEHYFATAFNLPGLSLPFVVSFFILAIFLQNFNHVHTVVNHISVYPRIPLPAAVQYYFQSLGLLLLQHETVAGIVVALGLLLFSRVLFILSVAGFAVSYACTAGLYNPQSGELYVYTGYNAVITAFALGGSMIIPSRKSLVLALLSAAIIVILYGFFARLLLQFGLPALVLPFNFLTLAALYSFKFRKEQTDLVLLYFTPGTPEENFYYHAARKSRFEHFKYYFPELPFFGEWFISQGFEGAHTHKDKWKYAWDFIVQDENNQQYQGAGNQLKDYLCYGIPVTAPLDGCVSRVIDGIPDNDIGDVNIERNWGNTVVIDHYEGLFSAFSHLEPGSVKVKQGDYVKRGDIIGSCGNSGRSPYPHLHFQFQASDKAGDATYQYPFANYISRTGSTLRLHSFDYPAEDMYVRNVETHKVMKQAYSFRLGDKFTWACTSGTRQWQETWEVHVDISNQLFIESSTGDKLYLFPSSKVFYCSGYGGKKSSALYYFYMSNMQVPLCYHKELVWADTYSPAQLPEAGIRYLTEFLLLAGSMISCTSDFRFDGSREEEGKFTILNTVTSRGKGVFSFHHLQFSGETIINNSGSIESFSFARGQKQYIIAVQVEA